jgi:hypothetical protein
LLDRLADSPAFAGYEVELAQATGTSVPEGSFGANRVTVGVTNSFLVQNSGSGLQRAGFTVGSGGLEVNALDSPGTVRPVDVIINGRAITSAGSVLINQFARDLVIFSPSQGGRGFSALSSLNGCLLSGTSCTMFGDSLVTAAIGDAAVDTRDVTAQEEEERKRAIAAAEDEKPVQVLIAKTIDATPVLTDPPVLEPVTGTGNPTLWIGEPK